MADVGRRHGNELGSHPVSCLTKHASSRMQLSRIGTAAVDAVLTYSRRVFTRGALIYAIGRNEVARHRREGIRFWMCAPSTSRTCGRIPSSRSENNGPTIPKLSPSYISKSIRRLHCASPTKEPRIRQSV
jgi:hypothetical protein